MQTLYCYCDGKQFWLRDRLMPLNEMERHADKMKRSVSFLKTYDVSGSIEAALRESNGGSGCDICHFSHDQARLLLRECAELGWNVVKDVFPEKVDESLEFDFDRCEPYGFASDMATRIAEGKACSFFKIQVGLLLSHAIGMGTESRVKKPQHNGPNLTYPRV